MIKNCVKEKLFLEKISQAKYYKKNITRKIFWENLVRKGGDF